MATAAQWQAMYDALVTALTSGAHVGSYSVGGRTFNYRSVDEILKLMDYAKREMATLDGTRAGMFQLVQFADL